MNLGGIIWDAINIYDEIAVEIYISGCNHCCPGCHNPEMQDFNYGEKINYRKLINKLKENENWFDIISILGGDILCQNDLYEVELFICVLKKYFPNKKLWLFTGKEYDEIIDYCPWCFEYFDVIKTGRYMENFEPGEKLASWNQKLLYKGIDY